MESTRLRWREGNVNDSWKHKANLQPRRLTLRGWFQGCESTVCTQRHVQAGLPPTPFRSPPTTLGLTFLLKDTTMHSKFSSLSSPSIGDDEMPPLLLTYFKPSFTLSMMWIYQMVDKLIKMCSICLFHSPQYTTQALSQHQQGTLFNLEYLKAGFWITSQLIPAEMSTLNKCMWIKMYFPSHIKVISFYLLNVPSETAT